MTATLKALSALLSYPTKALQEAASEIRDALHEEAIVSDATLAGLDRLLEEIATDDLFEVQERYVQLFDRTRSLSLHLFEHVHGESRDRGQAMIDLKALYEKNGLAIGATQELPDFLPLFLEFLSTQPVAEVRELLGQTAHIMAMLGERLTKRGAPYAAIFAAMTDIAGAPAGARSADLAATPADEPDDLEALDAAWQDAPVVFGPEAADSCSDGLVARLRAAKRPAARQ